MIDRETARALMLTSAYCGFVISRPQARALTKAADVDDEFLAVLENARDTRRRIDEANQDALRAIMLEVGFL